MSNAKSEEAAVRAAAPGGQAVGIPVAAEGEDEERISLAREFLLFLRENKKWWLIPLILMFGVIALALLATGKLAVLAPFLYTLM